MLTVSGLLVDIAACLAVMLTGLQLISDYCGTLCRYPMVNGSQATIAARFAVILTVKRLASDDCGKPCRYVFAIALMLYRKKAPSRF